MDRWLRIAHGIDGFNRRWGELASWLVLLACLVSAANAGARYTVSAGSNAWLELQWYLFAGMVLFGAAHTLRVNEHVRVDILYGKLAPRTRAWIDLFGLVFFLMPAMVLLAWLSWPMFAESWRIHEMSNNAGGLIRWPVKLMLPVGFALVCLQGIAEIIKRVVHLLGGAVVEAQYERPLQ